MARHPVAWGCSHDEHTTWKTLEVLRSLFAKHDLPRKTSVRQWASMYSWGVWSMLALLKESSIREVLLIILQPRGRQNDLCRHLSGPWKQERRWGHLDTEVVIVSADISQCTSHNDRSLPYRAFSPTKTLNWIYYTPW